MRNLQLTIEQLIASLWWDGLKLRDVTEQPTVCIPVTSAWSPLITSWLRVPSSPPAYNNFLCRAMWVNSPDAGVNSSLHISVHKCHILIQHSINSVCSLHCMALTRLKNRYLHLYVLSWTILLNDNIFSSAINSYRTIFERKYWSSSFPQVQHKLFCSLAIVDPRVCHTIDVLSPFISVLGRSNWLFHFVLSTYWCCPSRPCVVFLACVHLVLCLALSLSPGNSLVSSWCDHSMLASLLWQCLTVPSLLQLC